MKRVLFIFLLGCINASLARAQNISGEYITEWQWNMNKKTNWVNQLRLDLSIPFGNGKDSFEAATLHVERPTTPSLTIGRDSPISKPTICLQPLPYWASCTSGSRDMCS